MARGCPNSFPHNPVLQDAFQRMYDTETALDDVDYLTESPKLKIAMQAAEHFNRLLEIHERRRP